MTRALVPILLSVSLALGACGTPDTDDLTNSLEDFAADVRDWSDAHIEWSKALNTASESEVVKLAGKQVAEMRRAAEQMAEDVKAIDDEDLKKTVAPLLDSVDDVQKASQDVVAALRDKGQDAYLKALVAYEKIAAEAAAKQREVAKILEEHLGKP